MSDEERTEELDEEINTNSPTDGETWCKGILVFECNTKDQPNVKVKEEVTVEYGIPIIPAKCNVKDVPRSKINEEVAKLLHKGYHNCKLVNTKGMKKTEHGKYHK